MEIDTSTDFGARVARRLREEPLAWLTTVRSDGMPQPTPVWFLWDGETFLIYSQPNTQKLRNLESNPKASLNLDGDGQGGDIVIMAGDAQGASDVPPADRVPAYATKYAGGFARLNMTPEQFGRAYSVPIRLTPTKLSGH